ncbi:MAG: ribonuclease HII [Bacilli bacterium]|nr:ribonuclease HII [Bacilli bacterium]
MEDLYKYENELYKKGLKYIAGVDEVGRGPLIGNVVTACVVLPKDFVLEGLTDSKKLSEKKRDKFYDIIMDKAIAVGIGRCSEKEIDKYNIYEATKIAMKRAIDKANEIVKIEHILIDAMSLDIDIAHTSIIKGDAKSISIAAASVIAKVTRDREMYELDKIYPMYDLAKNKGYPTKKHREAIEEYGITKYHRLSYAPVFNNKDKINKIDIKKITN